MRSQVGTLNLNRELVRILAAVVRLEAAPVVRAHRAVFGPLQSKLEIDRVPAGGLGTDQMNGRCLEIHLPPAWLGTKV